MKPNAELAAIRRLLDDLEPLLAEAEREGWDSSSGSSIVPAGRSGPAASPVEAAYVRGAQARAAYRRAARDLRHGRRALERAVDTLIAVWFRRDP